MAQLIYDAAAAAGYEHGFARISSHFVPFLLRALPPQNCIVPWRRKRPLWLSALLKPFRQIPSSDARHGRDRAEGEEMSCANVQPCRASLFGYSRRLIQKLVTAGYLRDVQRHSLDAVRNAVERLRIDSRHFFDDQGRGL